jgi:polysaccharide export outer membrane protein
MLALTSTQGLEPGDLIRLNMYRYDGISYEVLSDTFPVEPDGSVYLPLVGRTRAVGLTIPELETRLYEEFSRYLQTPDLTIIPLHRITVLGHVESPGVYLADGSCTVAKLIAQAGGTTEIGDIGRVKVQRDGKTFGVKMFERVGMCGENEESLCSGDVLYVPRKFWPTWSELHTLLSLILTSYSIYRIVTD